MNSQELQEFLKSNYEREEQSGYSLAEERWGLNKGYDVEEIHSIYLNDQFAVLEARIAVEENDKLSVYMKPDFWSQAEWLDSKLYPDIYRFALEQVKDRKESEGDYNFEGWFD